MSRLPALAIENTPEKARPPLDTVQKQIGRLANFFAILADSAAATEGHRALTGAQAA
jgi:hypothetical protein